MNLSRLLRPSGATGRRVAKRRKLLSSGLLALVAATFVVLAVTAEGTPNSDVDLNDGSVWVTNTNPEYQLLGRLNSQIRELDLGLQSSSGDFDVFQRASNVFLYIRSGGRALKQIDVAAGRAGVPIQLSATTSVAFGGDTVAMLDTDTGKAWVRTSQTIRGFTQDEADPDLKVGRDGALTVGANGTAWFVSTAKRTVTPVSIDASGLPVVGESHGVGAKLGRSLQVTAVGDVPVILDRKAARLMRMGTDPVDVPTADRESLQLQQPGPASGSVYLATSESLLKGDLDGGDLDAVRDGFDGPPAAPVVHRGYVHGAWADPDAKAYVRIDASGDVHAEKIPSVTPTARLVFRTNRDVIVLNDIVSGDSWLVQVKGLPRVNNWDAIDPSKSKQPEPDPDPSKDAKVRRTERNHPPKARDDRLGARAGQDSVLPVTRNDVDLDGDILTVGTARDVKQISGPKPERIAIVGDGTQIQARFGPNEGGQIATFSYVASDGRENGTDQGLVVVPIVPASENTAPEPIKDNGVPRHTVITMDRGQRTTLFVLPDWTDADGDSLILKDASVGKGAGSVTFRPDGVIEFADNGRSGQKKIDIEVSDGRAGGTTKAQIDVNVSAKRGAAPTLLPDRAVGTVGGDILVEPLLNDASRDGTKLRLRDIVPPGGVEITTDAGDGTFVASTSRAGTYYLPYSAYTVRASANSVVRLDVLPKPKEDRPPVATKDVGLIPAGGHALIDLLANDYDPENGVLAVTSVEVPPRSGAKASLLQNRFLRVEASRDLTGPVSIDYTVSDGRRETKGSAIVAQATDVRANRPPIAADDRVTVRAGAVASVPVLDNDFDPDGDDLDLLQSDVVKPASLPLYVQGTELRFRAPARPGELRVAYGARDRRGQRDDAELLIEVIADDPDENAAPRPKPVTARAIGAHPVHVTLGLQDADPNGDAVSIRNVVRSPTLGRISRTGLDWIEYEAFPTKRGGTDSLELEVQDKYGLTGVQQVNVGVVPQTPVNHPPTALADRIRVRPDRVIQYDVLANDSDPDGDGLRLGLESATGSRQVTAKGRFVTVPVPSLRGAASRQVAIQYGISDSLGGSDTARFTVDAAADAPLHAPITQDDFADPSKIAGRSPGQNVAIDVLANDGDLDGRKADLKLVAFDKIVSVVKDNKLSVTLKATDQVVAYEVHDADDTTSYGFAFLSGTNTVPPIVDPKAVPIKVKAGETEDLDLRELVLVRRGRTPIVTAGDTVASAPFAGAAKASSKQRITLAAPKDYAGAAAVTLEVTDGTSLNDPTGLTSFLTIPVDIEGAPSTKEHNKPPAARDVTIQLQEDREKRFDLQASATDPNPDDVGKLRFSTAPVKGVAASVQGGTSLVLKAGKDVEDGAAIDVPFTVTDPQGLSARAVAHVSVVKTDKPLVTVGPIGPIEGQAGKPVLIDINEHASNTFDKSPLTVSNAAIESGEGSPSASGARVSVTPASGFSGTLTVKFTVLDGSGEPDREVTGRLEVAVSAPPSAPGRPTVSGTTASSATVTWAPAEDNGAPITEYKVSYSGGSKSCGTATMCDMTGLSPGTTYSFTVTATNKVGTSPPSAASEEVTPDKVPERMGHPSVSQDYTQRDRQLILSWDPPANEGSAIKTYEVHLLGTSDTRQATASPFTWTGLENGTSVQFEIRAVNNIDFEQRKQQFSEASGPETPFGVPAGVAKPRASASADDGVAGGIVTVTWNAPADNGDPIDKYKVIMSKDGTASVTKEVNGTTERFNVDNGHDYSVTVTAHNRAGFATSASTPSDGVNPYDKASQVRNLVKVSEGDKRAVINFSAPSDDGGRDIVGYEIASTGGATNTVTAAGQNTVSFNNNNSGPYTVTVVPITKRDGGGQLKGASASLAGVRPFGPPDPPSGGGPSAGYREVSFSGWSAPAENGRRIKSVQFKGSSGNWQDGGSTAWGTDQGGDQRCIELRTAAEGETPSQTLYSTVRQLCGNAQPREVHVDFQPTGPVGNCSSGCDYITIRVVGFRSGARYSVTPDDTVPIGPSTPPYPARTLNVGGDGLGSAGGWYTGCRNPVTGTVDGISETKTPPAPNQTCGG